MMKGIMKAGFFSSRMAALLAFVLLLAYFFQNDSGHTGINFLRVAFIIAAAGAVDFSINRKLPWVGFYVPYVSLAFYLHYTGRLLEYNDWIHRGMP
jgi:hypothetical protein